MRKFAILILPAVLFYQTFCQTVFADNAKDTAKTTAYLQSIKDNPNALAIFVSKMPKGGDLHTHRSGASYAENLISYAKDDNLCINPKDFSLKSNKDNHCADNNKLATLSAQEDLYDQVLNAWSLRNFIPDYKINVEQHFFAIFPKIGAITATHRAQTLAEILNRAGNKHLQYLEPMITTGSVEALLLSNNIKIKNSEVTVANFPALEKQFLAAGIKRMIPKVNQQVNANTQQALNLMHCNQDDPMPGCHVKFNYETLVLRNTPPKAVFAQMLLSFNLANLNNHIVAVNLVQAEDGYYSLHDYQLHMQMLNYFHQKYPNVRIALHAGELNPQRVTPEQLRDHIYLAVTQGHAERIGHGVDIAHEDKAEEILQTMATNHIAVEVPLTSNDLLLNIKANEHPIKLYLAHHVPVVLSTDDEGILRTDINREYIRAIKDYDLDYPTVKQIIRNSLTYSFIPGKSLWKDNIIISECSKDNLGSSSPTKRCQQFLSKSKKAQTQWQLEHELSSFEQGI